MELYNESYQQNQKNSKLPMIIGISIAILLIITIAIIYMIVYISGTVVEIKLNGVDASNLEEIFYIDENQNLYIPIRKVAKYFNYEDYSGDYKYKSEDQSKCYVKNETETAMFTLDSNMLVKTRGDSDYEYLELDQKVFEKDGELYTTIDGIKKAYNVEFMYDAQNKKINIYTMEYLITYYTTRLGIQDYSTVFSDQKAIFENMLIIKQGNQYGVINATTSSPILETKYDSIKYLPNTKDFLVMSNGKYGILSKDASTKIKMAYDEIKIMDNENGLFLIKENNLYGVANKDGRVIIEPEYQQIGIDVGRYSQNGIESGYIVADELIPIKSNGLWGFFNLEGQKIVDFQYTGIGCSSAKVSNAYPVLIIPSYKIIVVEKDNFYNLIRTNGKEILPSNVVDSLYLRKNASTGENTYFMTYNGTVDNIEERLSKLGM